MTTYHPNFTDPRVIKRVKTALRFVESVTKVNEETHISSTAITKYIGMQSNTLSSYLKEVLLLCINDHYSKDAGITKTYIKNWSGVKYLMAAIKGRTTLTYEEWEVQWLKDNPIFARKKVDKKVCVCGVCALCLLHLDTPENPHIEPEDREPRHTGQDLADKIDDTVEYYDNPLQTGEFEYYNKGDRDITPFQSIPKYIRNPVCNLYNYRLDYDIDCSMPTIISQYAKMNGLTTATPTIDYYINHKREVRQDLAKKLSINAKQVKLLINALCNKARLQKATDYGTTQIRKNILKSDWRIEFAQQNEFIILFRAEIDACWKHLIKVGLVSRSVKSTDEDGNDEYAKRGPTEYSQVYRQQETIVGRLMKQYINDNQAVNKCIFIHDGWVCQKEIDVDGIVQHIKDKTGYQLRLTCKQVNEK